MLKDLTVTDKDVMFFISKLNNSKSYFAPKIFFNMCIAQGYFPTEPKIAKVISLFKNKGNVSDNCNHSPMLSSFSKIFEKLLHKSIVTLIRINCRMIPSMGFIRKDILFMQVVGRL